MKRSRLQDYAGWAADWRHRAERPRALAKATPPPQARAAVHEVGFYGLFFSGSSGISCGTSGSDSLRQCTISQDGVAASGRWRR